MKLIAIFAIIALIGACQAKTMVDVGVIQAKCATDFGAKCTAQSVPSPTAAQIKELAEFMANDKNCKTYASTVQIGELTAEYMNAAACNYS